MTIERGDVEWEAPTRDEIAVDPGARRSLTGRTEARTRRPSRWWPGAGLAALLLLGGALIAYETRGTTFWADEWTWILGRRGSSLSTFLDPHNEHLSLVPIAIYKLLFATVGLRHYWPYRAIAIVAHLGCVALVFLYARTRVGDALALIAAALIVFFGPGWEEFLWPFQVAWLIAIAAGVGSLLLADRRDRIGEVGACALLAVSMASAGPGLAVALGMIVEVVQRRRWRDLWIVAVPVGLYGLWWIAYQQSNISRHAIPLVPQFMFDSAAGVLSSLAGLAGVNVANGTGAYLTWGPPLLVLAILGVLWRLRRLGRVPGRIATLLAMTLGFWLVTGLGRAYVSLGPIALTSTGLESRYLYVGAVLVVLLAVELARDATVPRGARIAIGVLAVAAVVSNLDPLQAGGGLLRSASTLTRAELGTIDMTRSIVNPGFRSGGFVFGVVQAGPYLAAQRALGYQPASAAEIAGDPDTVRAAADLQLIEIHRVSLSPAAGSSSLAVMPPAVDEVQAGNAVARGACVSYRPSAFTPLSAQSYFDVTLPPGGLLLSAGGGPAVVSLRRFSVQFHAIGTLSSGASAVLRIGPDLAPQPWFVRLAPAGRATACGLTPR